MRRIIHICLALIALTALALPASAAARSKKQAKPVITRVTPMRLSVGGKLTIRGKNFSPRRSRNTVVFRAPDKRTAFAKPSRASRHKLVVVVPRSMARSIKAGKTARFKIRVLVRRTFSSWTRKRLSPVVVSGAAGGGGGSGGGTTPSSCLSGDVDGDLLDGNVEQAIGTDPCLKDTDKDGVEDGYEYQSAKDLNNDEHQISNTSLPYPGKRPYPNPLDPADANTDYDGDSLTDAEEQRAWLFTISSGSPRTLTPLSYSAGEQYSVYTKSGDNRVPSLAAAGYDKQVDFLSWATANGYRSVGLSDGPPWYSSITRNSYGLLDFNRDGGEASSALPGFFFTESTYYDFDRDGFLSDDERDEDADGLTNYDETHGRMTPGYWASCYSSETVHPVSFAGTDFLDLDTDGDGVRDGADDSDFDDVPNVMELSRNAASGLNDTDGKSCVASDTLGGSNFAGSGGPLPDGAVVITFRNELGRLDVSQMTADGSALTGGSSPTVTVNTVRQGSTTTDEQQSITISGSPDGGGFTLTLGGQTTAQIAYNADAAAVESALSALFPSDESSNHPNAYGRVNPFNPCLPATWSRTCTSHPGFDSSGAPFDDSINWASLN